jgi:hypothetical protein
MPGLNITQFRNELRSHLGLDDIDLPNADADLILNRAKWDIEQKLDLIQNNVAATYLTTASNAEVNVANADAIISLAIVDDDGELQPPLELISEDTYNNIHSRDTGAEDRPTKYFPRGVNIVLEPTPDDIYTILATRKELLSDLSDIQATWATDETLHNILLFRAAYYGFLKLRDYNSANRMRSIFVDEVGSYVPQIVKDQKGENWKHAQVVLIRNEYKV